jgi:phosphoserine aminotransferase
MPVPVFCPEGSALKKQAGPFSILMVRGLSILEIGHRTSLFQGVVDEAMATARELMRLDSGA